MRETNRPATASGRIEGSIRLWETQPDEMACAVERLDQTLSKAIATRRWADDGSPFPTATSQSAYRARQRRQPPHPVDQPDIADKLLSEFLRAP
jgi:hypothetical protein